MSRLSFALWGITLSLFLGAQTPGENPSVLVNRQKAEAPLVEAELEMTMLESVDVELPEGLNDYVLFQPAMSSMQTIRSAGHEGMLLRLPGTEGDLELELVKVDLFSPGFTITLEPSGEQWAMDESSLGAHYRGIVSGRDGSIAAVSMIDGEMSGLISWPGLEGNLVMGKMEGSDAHIIYADKDIADEFAPYCGTDTETQTDGLPRKLDLAKSATVRCPDIHLDVSKEIFDNKGGTAGASAYMTGLFNQVVLLYSNDNIGISMAGMTIWSNNEPWSGLSDYRSYRESNTVPGDLKAYVNFSYGGGVAYLNGLCNSLRYSVSGIFASFSNIPTYSWSVNVLAHELGHNFGSEHTHDCAWNGNNTSIDGCGTNAGYGGCGGSNPSGGGTVMSYCHLTSVGVNLSLGFGPQPTARMSSYIDGSSCVSLCGPIASCDDGIQNGLETGVDCGGPQCPACPCNGLSYTLDIITDQYPAETSWVVTQGGSVVVSGGPYSEAFTTYSIPICLDEGCYEFTISDSYGDGICCSYGSGSYLMFNDQGALVFQGGEFTSNETIPFCTETTTPGCDPANFTDAPTGLNVAFTSNQLQASWNAYPNSRRCEIRGNRTSAANDGTFTAGSFSGSTEPTGRNFPLSQLLPNTEYRWRLRCGCRENGTTVWSPYTQYQFFTTPANFQPDGVDLFAKTVDAVVVERLFPNPSTGEVILGLSVDGDLNLDYQLVDLSGRVVVQDVLDAGQGYQDTRLDFSSIDAGLYLLNIQGSGVSIQEQLLIQR